MGGLLLKLQNFKKVKLIFGHPVWYFFKEIDATLLAVLWRTVTTAPRIEVLVSYLKHGHKMYTPTPYVFWFAKTLKGGYAHSNMHIFHF